MLSRRIASSVLRGLSSKVPRRSLNLHEHESAEIMGKFGVKVPRGAAAYSAEEAEKIAAGIGKTVVKAQVLAGGRGLGHFSNGFKSGVHLTDTPEEAGRIAGQMIGNNLITKQTDANGRPCNRVFVVEQLVPKHEKYFAILYDRASQGPLVIASAVGGVTIEDIAEKYPEQIIKQKVDIKTGLTAGMAQDIATRMKFEAPSATADAAKSIQALYEMFIQTDATMVEVNPFAETEDGAAACIDAKVNFDDNAQFRQKEIFSMKDKTQEDPNEVIAAEYDLNYIQLDGNIGCLVNGAGLAMSTMDICKLYGGEPANFLDLGGSATGEQVTKAFQILQSDKKVKAILVNIFGGIMKCDVIAEGVVKAARETNLSIPLVVRLQGTNVDLANEILEKSGLDLVRADSLDEAAEKAVKSLQR